MSKVVLDEVISGYGLSKINENFQKIEDELNNKVLYRDNPVDEINTIEQDLDLNGFSLYNVEEINGVAVDTFTANVDTVAGSIASINTVATNISNVNIVAGIDEDVTAVAVVADDVALLAPYAPDVSAYATGIYNNLASEDAGKGAELIEYQGGTVEDALDIRLPEFANYAALDAYNGPVLSGVYVKGYSSVFDGGHGVFRPTTDTPVSANGVYRKDALNRWWKREFIGGVLPAWFGASSSAADNTSALQAWLNYEGQSDLVGGPFKILSTIENNVANKSIIGLGGSIQADTVDMTCFKNIANNVTIKNIIINGNNKGRIGIWNTGQNCSIVENTVYNLASSTNVVIGVYSNNTSGRLDISRNKIYDINAGTGNATLGDSVGTCRGIYYLSSGTNNLSGFKINNNDIWNVLGEEGDAIHVANVPVSSVAPYSLLKGEIIGNRIKDATRRAIKVQAGKVRVIFNEYEHTIGAVSNAISVIEVLESNDCLVAFNEIDATAFSYGVAITQQTGSIQCSGNKVIGNTIESYSGLINSASSSPVFISGVQGTIVSQNKIKNGVIQIRLTNADASRVISNESYLTLSGTGTDSFISIESTCDDCVITGNVGNGDSGQKPSSGMIKVSGNGNKILDNHGRYDSSTAYIGIFILSGVGSKNIIKSNSNASSTQTVFAASTYSGNIIKDNFNRGSGSIGIVDSGEHVSADKGDANATLSAATGNTDTTSIWNTPLTADRTVTLSTVGAWNGAKLRIIRGSGASGAFNLNVGTGPLKALNAASQWCDVEFNGTAWILTAYGSL